MRRIVYIAVLALALASCTAVKEVAEPIVREKTPGERVDSVLLATASELAGLGVKDFLECMEIIIEKADSVSCDEDIALYKDGKPIVSVRLGLDNRVIVARGLCIGGRVVFVSDGGFPVAELLHYIKGCLLCKTEGEANALVECFNSSYEVTIVLDGETVGVLRMKTWEKDGKLTPAFVMDYDDGASCYLQLVF